jgi:hypothetical protein
LFFVSRFNILPLVKKGVELMDAIILRSLERILATACGGFSIYLGYRLFQGGSSARTRSSAHFALGEKASIDLTKVGPGVFFALFGASVVALSLWRGISTGPANGGKGVYYSGAQPETSKDVQAVTEHELSAARKQLAGNIAILNSLSTILKPDLPAERRADIELAVPEIKLALMKSVWDRRWGDPILFSDWVSKGASGTPPAGLEKAAAYYRQADPPSGR